MNLNQYLMHTQKYSNFRGFVLIVFILRANSIIWSIINYYADLYNSLQSPFSVEPYMSLENLNPDPDGPCVK